MSALSQEPRRVHGARYMPERAPGQRAAAHRVIETRYLEYDQAKAWYAEVLKQFEITAELAAKAEAGDPDAVPDVRRRLDVGLQRPLLPAHRPLRAEGCRSSVAV
jgi:hypothetical protein